MPLVSQHMRFAQVALTLCRFSWTSLGSIAGEVKNAQRAYPLGIGLALLLMVATYSLPVAVGISVDPSLNDWYSGMLETIAYRLAPWLGVWVTAAASAATLGELNACLCAYSRTAWVMARRGWLPKPIGHESRRYGTPVGSIVLHVVACAGLMAVPFPALVVVDTMLNNISLLLQGVVRRCCARCVWLYLTACALCVFHSRSWRCATGVGGASGGGRSACRAARRARGRWPCPSCASSSPPSPRPACSPLLWARRSMSRSWRCTLAGGGGAGVAPSPSRSPRARREGAPTQPWTTPWTTSRARCGRGSRTGSRAGA